MYRQFLCSVCCVSSFPVNVILSDVYELVRTTYVLHPYNYAILAMIAEKRQCVFAYKSKRSTTLIMLCVFFMPSYEQNNHYPLFLRCVEHFSMLFYYRHVTANYGSECQPVLWFSRKVTVSKGWFHTVTKTRAVFMDQRMEYQFMKPILILARV